MKIISKQIFILLIVSIIFSSCGSPVKKDIVFIPDGSEVILIEKSEIILDDGDTFEYRGKGIRVLGMDTPEISHPEHGFHEDQSFGREASAYTAALLHNAEVISYLPYQDDRYGRMLAHVFVDGELLSIQLIEAGLAYETVSYYGDNGFPELAERILETAENSEVKEFIPPYKWRREHRRSPRN
ncbi:MAG: hypothetical protein GF315_00945 [candidate division Zixibacteria bacterium]|nr:hypothetical protein [candidate division Zixibacteria bacterium]